MKNKVLRYIDDYKLLNKEDTIIIGLSGGADSMALTHILHESGFRCIAAHCNFHLRGLEADRDEKFVTDFCNNRNIDLIVTHFDTIGYAAKHKLSIEMAARDLRYEWFEKLRLEYKAQAIAIAHHKDDNVETFFLNLLRGSGIDGLLGIRPQNGYIVRPLLCVDRSEIIRYIENEHLSFVTDSSNLENEYTRNKIRNVLLPLMSEINPSIKETIINTENYLNETAIVYHHTLEEEKKLLFKNNIIDIDKLKQMPSTKALLYDILSPFDFNSSQIEQINKIIDRESGKEFISKSGYRLIKDR